MDVWELEAALCRVPGVAAVRVVANGEGVKEVHVLCDSDMPPEQVVEEVRALADTHFGLSVPAAAVSVVRLGPTLQSRIERPAVRRVREVADGNRTNVSVTLGWNGRSFLGEAVGSNAAGNRLRLVGEATLRAIQQALRIHSTLALGAVSTSALGRAEVVMASIVTAAEGEQEVLVGAAQIRNDSDSPMAAARAVLDALNRRMPFLPR